MNDDPREQQSIGESVTGEAAMSFQKILVALDNSIQSPVVFDYALEQAQADQGCLMIVHTVRADTEVSTGAFMGLGTIADVDMYGALKKLKQEQLQRQIQHAKEWLNPYYQKAIEAGIPTELDCRSGEPSVVICELAQNWEADLIILGRRGHQGVKEIVLGSVSNYVVHHAPCSVLVVQGIVAIPDPSSPEQLSKSSKESSPDIPVNVDNA